MTFHEWFNSAPHRAKYGSDHPAYLAAQEAWDELHELERLKAFVMARPEVQQAKWRDHVEQKLLTWRQSFVNRSGDQLALDDFMDKQSLDDLIDFVCDEYAEPAQPVTFYVYKPTPPSGNLGEVSDGDLPWVYDQDPSSGFSARMLVTPFTPPANNQ